MLPLQMFAERGKKKSTGNHTYCHAMLYLCTPSTNINNIKFKTGDSILAEPYTRLLTWRIMDMDIPNKELLHQDHPPPPPTLVQTVQYSQPIPVERKTLHKYQKPTKPPSSTPYLEYGVKYPVDLSIHPIVHKNSRKQSLLQPEYTYSRRHVTVSWKVPIG